MAFRDQLRKYKVGTGLAQSSSEELNSLTAQAERPGAPISPMESSVIGASPDVAKMAGTPAQKTSALRFAIQQSKNLSDQQRTAQQRGATSDEQGQVAKAEQAQKLGGLQGRVQALTSQLLTQAQGQAGTAQMQVNPETLNQFPPESQAEATELLNKLGSNTATNQDILRLNQLLGKTSQADMLNADQIKANFMPAASAIGTNIAQATPDQVSVSQIDPTTLGFADMNELASTLGIPPEELGDLSLQDLQKQAQEMFTKEFTKVSSLEAKANDVNLGPAERAEARKELRDLGAVGVREAESATDKLADQIANADEVKFNNETMPIKDMLSDEFISGVVARYINSDDIDPFKDELKANEPELVDWIESNKAALEMAAKNVDEDVQRFAEIQQNNNNFKNVNGGEPLSDNIMKAVIPDWGSLRAEEYNISEMPSFIQALHSETADPAGQANLRAAVDTLNQTSPDLVKQLAQMSQQNLADFGLTVAPDPQDPRYQKWQQYQSYLKDYQGIQAMDQNPDSIAKAVFGRGASFSELENLVREARKRERSGLFQDPGMGQLLQALDPDRDGELPSQDEIRAKLKDFYTSGGQPFGLISAMQQLPESPSMSAQKGTEYVKTIDPLYEKVKDAFGDSKDPKSISSTEASKIAKNLNAAEIQELYNRASGKFKKNTGALNTFVDAYRKYFKPKEVIGGRFDSLMNATSKLINKARESVPQNAYEASNAPIKYADTIYREWSKDTYSQLKSMRDVLERRYNEASGLDKILYKELYDRAKGQTAEYLNLKGPPKGLRAKINDNQESSVNSYQSEI